MCWCFVSNLAFRTCNTELYLHCVPQSQQTTHTKLYRKTNSPVVGLWRHYSLLLAHISGEHTTLPPKNWPIMKVSLTLFTLIFSYPFSLYPPHYITICLPTCFSIIPQACAMHWGGFPTGNNIPPQMRKLHQSYRDSQNSQNVTSELAPPYDGDRTTRELHYNAAATTYVWCITMLFGVVGFRTK